MRVKDLHGMVLAEDLIWWAIFRLQDIKKQWERRKTKGEKGKQKKEEKTWRHEKKHPPFRWGFFLAKFNYKTGGKWDF